MRALVCTAAVWLGGCASAPVPETPAPTCADSLWVTAGQVDITGACEDGRALRVICPKLTKRSGCEFSAPSDCRIARLLAETKYETVRRSALDYPARRMPGSYCIWLETLETYR